MPATKCAEEFASPQLCQSPALADSRVTALLKVVTNTQRSFIHGRPAQEIFTSILQPFLDLVESEFGFIGECFYDEKGAPYLKTHAITNIAWSEETRRIYDENVAKGFEFRNLETLFGVVLRTGKPIISNEPSTDTRRGGLPPGHPHLESFLGLPVCRDGVLLGMVGVANRPGGYDGSIISFIEPFLATCASLFEARRNEQIRRQLTSELEQTVAELRRSHDNLTAMFDLLAIGTIVIDEVGKILHTSTIGRQLLGLRGVGVGQLWHNVLDCDPTAGDALTTCMKLPERARSRVGARITGPGGAVAHVEIDVRDDPRDPNHRILFVYDVSDLFAQRRRLVQRHHGLVGNSPAMQELYDSIDQVAAGDWSVLLEGETGAGKELTARAIHDASSRASKAFVAVNCAGLTDTLLGSQLFGHVKGAFTGAVSNRQGLFEAACGGTIFLDEIGDISLEMQRSLLRVLQEREITRVGETRPRAIDVRVIAATHRDIRAMSKRGEFRSDLMYRIRIVRVTVPALRQHKGDIPALVSMFLNDDKITGKTSVRGVTPAAMQALRAFDWPGNVRELRSAIEHGVAHCRSESIDLRDLPPEVVATRSSEPPARSGAPSRLARERAATPEDPRERILNALHEAEGNRSEAAKLLGVGRATLYRRMKKLDIDPTELVPDSEA